MKLHNWMVLHWKPACAFIYTMICVFDFIVFPSWVGWNRVDMALLVEAVQNLDPMVQQSVIALAYREYAPYTLKGGGLFHLAFGALLTGSAVTKDRIERIQYSDKGVEYKRRKEDNLSADIESKD